MTGKLVGTTGVYTKALAILVRWLIQNYKFCLAKERHETLQIGESEPSHQNA